jgi:hypothetical protein
LWMLIIVHPPPVWKIIGNLTHPQILQLPTQLTLYPSWRRPCMNTSTEIGPSVSRTEGIIGVFFRDTIQETPWFKWAILGIRSKQLSLHPL